MDVGSRWAHAFAGSSFPAWHVEEAYAHSSTGRRLSGLEEQPGAGGILGRGIGEHWLQAHDVPLLPGASSFLPEK